MKLWVDDLREPWRFGRLGWQWAKTYEEAIAALATGTVTAISLDHDLCDFHYDGTLGTERTGYHIALWMVEHDMIPQSIFVHSMNPAGRERIIAAFRNAGHPVVERVACQ